MICTIQLSPEGEDLGGETKGVMPQVHVRSFNPVFLASFP
jgi:hypothetical protein